LIFILQKIGKRFRLSKRPKCSGSSFNQIGEDLAWREDLDLGMHELAALMTISVKEFYASSGSSENLRGMRVSTKEENKDQSALLKLNL